jgi:hypothetical protein
MLGHGGSERDPERIEADSEERFHSYFRAQKKATH